MTSRRKFLSQLTQASMLACIPIETRGLFQGASKNPELSIEAVDVLKVSGPYTWTRGFNAQYQVQPIHIYPDARPEPYRDETDPQEVSGTLTHHYIRIRTSGGIEGFYGYIDPETLT